jgi:hypothetical protein
LRQKTIIILAAIGAADFWGFVFPAFREALLTALWYAFCLGCVWGLLSLIFNLIAALVRLIARRPYRGLAPRLSSIAGRVAFVLAFLFMGTVLWGAYDPLMLFNPVTRYLYPQRTLPNGTEVSLIPGLFKPGTPRAQVVSDLEAAGFKAWPMVQNPQGFTEVYHRWAGQNLSCGYEFFVQLAFRPDGGLLKAVNQQGGACL